MSINNIVASCRSNNCSFVYSEDLTPYIISVSPTEGRGGDQGDCTELTIQCSGCGDGVDDNTVRIGGVECVVTSSSATEIVCCPGKHLYKDSPRYH